MEPEMQVQLVKMFEAGQSILKSVGPSKRRKIDEVEVVFLNVVNGRNKPSREWTWTDVLDALEGGGKPIGLIFVKEDPDDMEHQAFPDLGAEETQVLLTAFAEAQDDQRADLED